MSKKVSEFFVSTIIPTIARPSLERAVQSLLAQELPVPFEIIIVNDTGEVLPEREWMRLPQVRVVTINRRRHVVASNVGAAIAKGRYLHFLHDDDCLLPGGLKALWELAQTHPDAGWLYGGTELVDLKHQHLINLIPDLDGNIFTPVMVGEWTPLGSSLIRNDVFFEVGGFDPNLKVGEDNDLTRKVILKHDAAVTAHLVSGYTIEIAGSSLPRELDRSFSRISRQNILDKKGVYQRLMESANSSFWYGSVIRLYLGAMVIHLGQGQFFQAISKAIYSLRGLVRSHFHIFRLDFWKAILFQYKSITFSRGFQLEQLNSKTLSSISPVESKHQEL